MCGIRYTTDYMGGIVRNFREGKPPLWEEPEVIEHRKYIRSLPTLDLEIVNLKNLKND